VDLSWQIPDSKNVKTYKVNARLDVYDNIMSTKTMEFSSYQKVTTLKTSGEINLASLENSKGQKVADVRSIYASNPLHNQRFHVESPDGTCVIGKSQECMVKQSTFGKHGGFEFITLDDTVHRVRYSGTGNSMERFSITSLDPIQGNWKIKLESDDKVIPEVFASDDAEIKIHYVPSSKKMVILR
jgi:hypothetical protein